MADEMIAHARAELPNEACGILAGEEGRAVKFFPARNNADGQGHGSPTRYVVDPQDQLRILNEMHIHDWELYGIFHSHTHTQAYPSSTDVNLAANWPEAYYLIASFMTEPPHIRSFRIVGGAVAEEEIAFRDDA